jgi:hypothetical protein
VRVTIRWFSPVVVAAAIAIGCATYFYDLEIRPKVDLGEGNGRAGGSKRMMPFTVESD